MEDWHRLQAAGCLLVLVRRGFRFVCSSVVSRCGVGCGLESEWLMSLSGHTSIFALVIMTIKTVILVTIVY